MGLENLPQELIRDIIYRISPPDWHWNDHRPQIAWLLSLRLVCPSFDSAVIAWFISTLKENPKVGTLPLACAPPTPSCLAMCRRLLGEQVAYDGMRRNYLLVDTVVQTVQTVVDLLGNQDKCTDQSVLYQSYLESMISTVVGFVGVYPILSHLSGQEAAEEGDGFVEEDRLHNALVVAAGFGQIDHMKVFIEAGANINFDKDKGWLGSPFHAAAIRGHVDVLRFLIDRGVDPGLGGVGSAKTALHYAAIAGQEEVVRFLLGLGVEADPRDKYGETPLLHAAGAGYEGITRVLLQRKTDVNRKCDEGRAILLHAVRRQHADIVKALLERDDINLHCTDPSELDASPLALAAALGDERIVSLLLNHPKIDIHAKDSSNQTILKHAVAGGNEAIVRTIVSLPDMDVNARGEDGSTPLMWAAQECNGPIIRFLLAQDGIDVNALTQAGSSALLLAVSKQNAKVVTALLGHKDIDVNHVYMETENREQGPILGLVASVDMVEMAKALLGHPDINPGVKDRWGRTPLSMAAAWNSISTIQLLLARDDVDVNARDASKYTALMHAAEGAHVEALKALLEHPDIQVGLKNDSDETALELATERGCLDAVQLLLEPNLGFTKGAIDDSIMVARHDRNKALEIYLQSQLSSIDPPGQIQHLKPV